DVAEMLQIEQFALAPATVPVGHLAAALQRVEEMEKVRSHRCHAGATADVKHFRIGWFDEEFTIRTADRDLVAGFRIEDEAGTDPRVHVHPTVLRTIPRWRGDTDVEHDDVPFGRVVGH